MFVAETIGKEVGCTHYLTLASNINADSEDSTFLILIKKLSRLVCHLYNWVAWQCSGWVNVTSYFDQKLLSVDIRRAFKGTYIYNSPALGYLVIIVRTQDESFLLDGTGTCIRACADDSSKCIRSFKGSLPYLIIGWMGIAKSRC